MQAHRSEATVSGDGSVVVHGVPFPEGEAVEVIVLLRASGSAGGHGDSSQDPFPLRGTVRRYDLPFDPAAPADDWEGA